MASVTGAIRIFAQVRVQTAWNEPCVDMALGVLSHSSPCYLALKLKVLGVVYYTKFNFLIGVTNS